MTVVINGTTGFTGPQADGDATINGLTVGKGLATVSTNTAVGVSALAANTSGATNTAVGNTALQANTTGINNSALGHAALVANLGGSENSAYGSTALVSNTSGNYNTAVGRAALYSNTTASNNTAVGYQALYSSTTSAGNNTAVGDHAGYSGTTAAYNTLIGAYAGYSLTTGSTNTFIGNGTNAAGYYVTTGSKNTIVGGYSGNQGGLDIRTASNYIVLSDGDGNPRQVIDSNGCLILGNTAASGSSTKFETWYTSATQSAIVVRNTSTTYNGAAINFLNINNTPAGYINQTGLSTVAYTTSSDYRLKENIQSMTGALATVAQLNPVTYNWKADGIASQGFIAHELQEVVPDCVTGEKDAVDEDGNPVYQGIDTSFLVATLTAAIKELNTKVDAQAAEIAALKDQA